MHRLRLRCNGRPETGLRDQRNSQPIAVFNGDALQVDCFLEAAKETPFDISTLASLTLRMKESVDADSLLFTPAELSSFTACTWEDWKADAGYHARFTLTNDNMTFVTDLASAWLAVIATLTDGSQYTFAAGAVIVSQQGIDGTSSGSVDDGILRLVSPTPDSEGLISLTASGITIKIPLS